jgi:NAD(P)-dependent dehydrogenase (short-subunit alcohol dehydrogenase family)
MGRYDGRVAVVTGAARGIGAGTAKRFADEGAAVAILDLDEDQAQATADSLGAEKAVGVTCNVGDAASVDAAVGRVLEELGGVHVLVNNAGITRDRMLVNMSEEEWDSVLAVHLKGHFAPTRHAAAYWREQSKAGEEVRGRVINTSSPSGVFGNVGQTNYGAAKAGIAGFTIIAAQELARYGVTVNCLAPNARTRMTEASFGEIPKPEEGFDAMDPANIAPIVVALCADEAQDITGQCFFIYGGAVNVLRPWDAGELFARDDKWDADELLARLRERFPGGTAPEGMVAQMGKAGGRSLQVG